MYSRCAVVGLEQVISEKAALWGLMVGGQWTLSPGLLCWRKEREKESVGF